MLGQRRLCCHSQLEAVGVLSEEAVCVQLCDSEVQLQMSRSRNGRICISAVSRAASLGGRRAIDLFQYLRSRVFHPTTLALLRVCHGCDGIRQSIDCALHTTPVRACCPEV